ncbi:MAG: MFS transporter, partial [Oscillospiraceae bacterium]|nr:MFS transporter [Oscillospiraceae bacterium]
IATLYRTAVGVTISQIAVIESISLVLSFVFEVPWGILADRIGYKKTIIICNLMYFASKLIFWKASRLFGFFAERVILSVVISGLSGVDVSVLYLSCPPEKSQRTFGIYSVLGTMGLLISSIIYSVFIGSNYRLAGALTALSYGVAMILSFGITEVRHTENVHVSLKQMFLELKSNFLNKRLLLFLLASALLTQTYQSVTVFFSQLKFADLGANAQDIGVLHIAVTIAGFVSVFSEKITGIMRRKTPTVLAILTSFFCAVLAETSALLPAALAIIFLQGVFSVFEPLQISLENQMVQSKDRATALSINTVITDSTAAGLSVALGYAAEINLSLAFCLCALLCITSAVLIELSNKRTL